MFAVVVTESVPPEETTVPPDAAAARRLRVALVVALGLAEDGDGLAEALDDADALLDAEAEALAGGVLEEGVLEDGGLEDGALEDGAVALGESLGDGVAVVGLLVVGMGSGLVLALARLESVACAVV